MTTDDTSGHGAADTADWQAEGLCAQTDPDAFFPEKGGSTRDAKAICRRCPVIDACREYALAADERFGIWGGMSERERRAVRRQRGLAAPVTQRARDRRDTAREMADTGASTAAIARTLGLGRTTVANYLTDGQAASTGRADGGDPVHPAA